MEYAMTISMMPELVPVSPPGGRSGGRGKKYEGWDRILKEYGVTKEDWLARHRIQGGLCGICTKKIPPYPGTRCHTDHDHETGQFRGLLCGACNTRLGWVEQVGLSAIESYLVNSDGKGSLFNLNAFGGG